MKFFRGITSGPNIKDLGVVYPKTSSLFYFNNFGSIILKEIFLSKNSISCMSIYMISNVVTAQATVLFLSKVFLKV